MSRKIRIIYEARDKRDGKEMLRWLQSDATQGIDDLNVEVKIDNRDEVAEPMVSVPDERLETEAAAEAGQELDRLAELAVAVEEWEASGDALEGVRRRRQRQEAARQRWGVVVRGLLSGGYKLAVELMKARISG